MRETKTGEIGIGDVKGNNAVLKRKSGKEIRLEPAEKLTFAEFFEKMPKIEDGDMLITGARSAILVGSSWDSGKTEPTEDSMLRYKLENSMGLTLGPNSKARLSTTSWSKIDEDRRMKTHGKGVIKVELIKGIFLVRVKNALELITPTAVFEKPDARTTEFNGAIEVTKDGTTYLVRGSKLKVKNRKTGKTYLAKGNPSILFSDEIIITQGSIYRKPMSKVDERIGVLREFGLLGVWGIFGGTRMFEAKDSAEMLGSMVGDPAKLKDVGSTMDSESLMNKAMAGIEMFSQMKPEDMEKLFKQFGMTEEQLKDMKAGLKEFKQQDKGKIMEEMKKVTKEAKAAQATRADFYKGFTPEHMEKFKEVTKYRVQGVKKQTKETWEKFLKKYSFKSMPDYPPLEAQYKVA